MDNLTGIINHVLMPFFCQRCLLAISRGNFVHAQAYQKPAAVSAQHKYHITTQVLCAHASVPVPCRA